MSFFKLSKSLQELLQRNNYLKPTPIQEKVIPLVLEGHDIMAQAQTGTGKSAAFVLPLLEKLAQNPTDGKRKIKVLVLSPTRELTLQISETFLLFSKALNPQPKIVSIIGGEGIGEQIHSIQKGCDIIVATSGRFLDVLSKNQMSLKHLEYFVLDEADKMLNFSFSEALDEILKAIPSKRQNLLFSATYPQKILDIATKVTTTAVKVSVEYEEATVEKIKQRVIEVNPENRGPLLRYLLKQEKWKQVLVFMANKRATDNIAEKFRKRGYLAESFHADLSQEDRNYDLPRSPVDYIHRIGRTGRAGKTGIAISFIGYEEQAHFNLIEKRSQIKLERESIKGYELKGEALQRVKGLAPIKGKKKSKKDKRRELEAKNILLKK